MAGQTGHGGNQQHLQNLQPLTSLPRLQNWNAFLIARNERVTGIINHDGAFAEEVAVALGTLHEIPDGMDPEVAALTEPLAAALQTFEMSPVAENQTVVVIGPGRLGILIVFVAHLLGCRVIAISRSEKKRARSLAFGASQALSPEQAESRIKEITGGLGADLVVDATGHPDGITKALSMVRPREHFRSKPPAACLPKGWT